VLIEVALGLRFARRLEIPLGLAAAAQNPTKGYAFPPAQPLGNLARLTKLDDVTHPELDDHRAM
jgi:hypothetical protein